MVLLILRVDKVFQWVVFSLSEKEFKEANVALNETLKLKASCIEEEQASCQNFLRTCSTMTFLRWTATAILYPTTEFIYSCIWHNFQVENLQFCTVHAVHAICTVRDPCTDFQMWMHNDILKLSVQLPTTKLEAITPKFNYCQSLKL